MQMYETIFILDSLLAPEEIDKIIDRVKEMIETNGGKILTVEKWGKRRLAYEIQKKQYGFYVAIEFEGEGAIPNSLEREYNFNDKAQILDYFTRLTGLFKNFNYAGKDSPQFDDLLKQIDRLAGHMGIAVQH